MRLRLLAGLAWASWHGMDLAKQRHCLHPLHCLLRALSGGGPVVPESFTHGTSAQRQRWFSTGLKSGSVQSCDTFKATNL